MRASCVLGRQPGAGVVFHDDHVARLAQAHHVVGLARRQCHRQVNLPQHRLPSPQAFITAAMAGMGWGLQPLALVKQHLKDGSLVELVLGTPLDVPLFWHTAQAAQGLVDGLSRAVHAAARQELRPP
jgi:LysR family transcriptional regulator, chromosome initiation inhibitor